LARIVLPPVTVAVRLVSRKTTTGVVLTVLGALDQAAADLVRAEVAGLSATSLVLELAGLVSFDDAGLAVLRELSAAGARIEGASPFVSLRLGADSDTRDEGADAGGADVREGKAVSRRRVNGTL
jgi:ABC-type transporter Mla MlaB component